jgi:hypothetical protein
MASHDEILEILRVDLEEAKSKHEQAQAAFWSIAGDSRQLPRVPTGHLQVDGSEPIRKAFYAEIEARERYIEALHRFNDFVVHGRMMMDSEPDNAISAAQEL